MLNLLSSYWSIAVVLGAVYVLVLAFDMFRDHRQGKSTTASEVMVDWLADIPVFLTIVVFAFGNELLSGFGLSDWIVFPLIVAFAVPAFLAIGLRFLRPRSPGLSDE